MDQIVPPSKSEMIRAHILKSWNQGLKIIGSSKAEDVVNSRKALQAFGKKQRDFYLGDSALGLRLWLARVSREKGTFQLDGSEALFRRPQQELYLVLRQLGAEVFELKNAVRISSSGWHQCDLDLDFSKSSQFASAVVMNAWNLGFDLELNLSCKVRQGSYFELTLQLLKQSGMNWKLAGKTLAIPKNQKITIDQFEPCPDISTAFTMVAWALVSQRTLRLTNFPLTSLQPDFTFLDILKLAGARLNLSVQGLAVEPSALSPVCADLSNCPDLFPVLSILCATVDGKSALKGTATLKWKESDRLRQVVCLLGLIGRKFELLENTLVIHGRRPSAEDLSGTLMVFDPQDDHRMVMAAQTARFAGFNISVRNPQAISKTAPELLAEVVA